MGKFRLVCRDCGKEFAPNALAKQCACGGVVDPDYDLRSASIHASDNPYLRFFDLLPIRDPSSIRWLGDGNTPTVHATRLGKLLGLDNLWLKDETKNPTRTTKDRMAATVLAYFHELGIKEFSCSSTGNSSTSFAYGVEKFAGYKVHIFVGRDFMHRMTFKGTKRVKVYLVRDANFAEAHEAAISFAVHNQRAGIASEGGFFNPGRREGLKLAYLEAALDMPRSPDWYFQASSSGMGVYGTWRAAQQLLALGKAKHLPRLACVQQDTCAPMVKSWRAGSPTLRPEDIVKEPHGIAEAILRGNATKAYPHMYKVVKESNGTFCAVSEAQIREAQRMIFETEGIPACPSASTTVAAIRQRVDAGELRRDEMILANITGALREGGPTPSTYVSMGKETTIPGVLDTE